MTKYVVLFTFLIIGYGCEKEWGKIENIIIINSPINIVENKIANLNEKMNYIKVYEKNSNFLLYKSKSYSLPNKKTYYDLNEYKLTKIDKNKIKVELRIYQIGKDSKKLIIDDYISYANLLNL